MSGDALTSVDGRSTAGQSLATVSKWLLGQPRTRVSLELHRILPNGKTDKLQLQIPRGEPRAAAKKKAAGSGGAQGMLSQGLGGVMRPGSFRDAEIPLDDRPIAASQVDAAFARPSDPNPGGRASVAEFGRGSDGGMSGLNRASVRDAGMPPVGPGRASVMDPGGPPPDFGGAGRASVMDGGGFGGGGMGRASVMDSGPAGAVGMGRASVMEVPGGGGGRASVMDAPAGLDRGRASVMDPPKSVGGASVGLGIVPLSSTELSRSGPPSAAEDDDDDVFDEIIRADPPPPKEKKATGALGWLSDVVSESFIACRTRAPGKCFEQR
mmetsp:Transcript_6544/g.16062  ORF Transcript_6544/g.16062 Transcript_6544/m.16062 type:complete len:324 (+) Transcript_6544:768-1739(+)